MSELEGRKEGDYERDEVTCASEWVRDLARTVKVVRLYRARNPVAVDTRGRLADALASHLARFGSWSFRVTANEITFGDAVIVKPEPREGREHAPPTLLEQLPFLFFRDGVRQMTFLPGIPPHDVDALVDSLIEAWSDRGNIDDVVTFLWQANPTHLHLETVPFEQMLYVSTGPGKGSTGERGHGMVHGMAPASEEIRADLGDGGGAGGLQRETGFEDEAPDWSADVREAYAQIARAAAPGVAQLQADWDKERRAERLPLAAKLFDRVTESPHGEDARAILARYVVTGVAGSIAHVHWDEACRTLDLVRRLDAGGAFTAGALIEAVAQESEMDLGDSLDEATPTEQAQFFAFAVGLGEAGVSLGLAALAGATKPRTRAAACTALGYLCSDNPETLADAVGDARPEVVLGVVSVLGQIGGTGVLPLLGLAAQHPNPRIRREVAKALAGVPAYERAMLLIKLIEANDPLLNAEALKVARLEPDPRIARAILKLAEDPAFEDRPEEIRTACYHALADTGGDSVVAALEEQLTQGSWFARPSWRRSAAAYALARVGTEAARAALDRGLRHPPRPCARPARTRSSGGPRDRRPRALARRARAARAWQRARPAHHRNSASGARVLDQQPGVPQPARGAGEDAASPVRREPGGGVRRVRGRPVPERRARADELGQLPSRAHADPGARAARHRRLRDARRAVGRRVAGVLRRVPRSRRRAGQRVRRHPAGARARSPLRRASRRPRRARRRCGRSRSRRPGRSRRRRHRRSQRAEAGREGRPREQRRDRGARGRAQEVRLGSARAAVAAHGHDRAGGLALRHAKRVVQPLIDGVEEGDPIVLGLVGMHRRDDYTYARMVNAVLIAVTIAQKIGLDRASMSDLAVATLLQGVGRDESPDPVRWGVLGALQIARYTSFNRTTLRAMQVALESNRDLEDHSPRSVLAQIAAIANCYTRLVSARTAVGTTVTPAQALGMVLGPYGHAFSPALRAALVQSLGFHPPGTCVELDDGFLAVVVAPRPEDPDRPIVRVICGPGKRPLLPPGETWKADRCPRSARSCATSPPRKRRNSKRRNSSNFCLPGNLPPKPSVQGCTPGGVR
jgi:HD-GYP domain-containing protein (c-di-GMP phosphodiesterase class II)